MDLKKILLVGFIAYAGYRLARPKATGTDTGNGTAAPGTRPGTRDKLATLR